MIDNGNHLILSGNHAMHDYLATHRRRGSRWPGRTQARFDFVDVRERRSAGPARRTTGRCPGGCCRKAAACRARSAANISRLRKLLLAPTRRAHRRGASRAAGRLWERLLRPLLLAALNTEPETASARLAGAVMRETLAKGGRAYRPRIAASHLGGAFIDPALALSEDARAPTCASASAAARI